MSKKTFLRSIGLSVALLPGVLQLLSAAPPTRAARTSGADAAEAAALLRRVAFVAPAHLSRAPGQQQPPPPGDRPVEQTRKNIQVLKGLPEAQLFPLMNLVGASLGVQCGFCHVRQGNDWVWESDDKAEKRTARRMMQMVLDVNKTNGADFRGNSVTCFTCHQGHTEPVSMLTLPVTRSAHEPGPPAGGANTSANPSANTAPNNSGANGAAASAAPTRVRPTAEQLIATYVAAVGGRDADARLQTRVLKGTVERSQGRTGPLEVTIKGTDKLIAVATLPQGTMTQVLDAGGGWVRMPNPQHARDAAAPAEILRPVTPAEAAQLRAAREMFEVVKISAPLPGMKFAGREQVGGRDAYVAEATTPEGKTVRYYFDVETGLLVRRLTLTPTLLFPIPEQVDYEDYRDVGGLKVPFIIRTSTVDTFSSATRKFTEIKHNVPVDDTIFRMPAAPAAAPAATTP